MPKPKDKEERVDVLEDIKRLEKAMRARTLLETLSRIKKDAKLLLEIKERTTIRLEELDYDEKDIKRIIDFVNSLKEVQLSDDDKKELREEIKDEAKTTKEEVEEKFKEAPPVWNPLANVSGMRVASLPSYSTSSSLGPSTSTTMDDLSYQLTDGMAHFCASSGEKLDLKL